MIPDPLLAILLVVFLAVPIAACPPRLHAMIERFASDVACVDAMNVSAAEWVATRTPSDATIAAQDAGASRYFGQREVVDLIGLNDHRLIEAGLDGGTIGPYLLERAPDYFLLLDPDAGSVELIQLARSLGMRELARFDVPRYTPFLQDDGKGIVLYGR